eukprot:TRINITY_DN29356_c0_g1_i1.p3 TRINITY_DN29356_c0_g1~~TRINITY_DN29356_c0_g1_i1.p3  ORF type:complete len:106 (-),score=32.42 TRINITY_DN29356_c0_g1_i1:278-595(-)
MCLRFFLQMYVNGGVLVCGGDFFVLFSVVFFFFSSRRRHTRSCLVSWARRCVQETGINAEYMGYAGKKINEEKKVKKIKEHQKRLQKNYEKQAQKLKGVREEAKT